MSDHTIDGVGPQKRQPDPRGVLVFDWLTPELQACEDATQCNDFDRLDQQQCQFGSAWFRRASTPAERALLRHLGFEVPDDLKTLVAFPASGVRNRSFPELGV